jgi:formaldehyde-activating enzyme involved in methanogenesis
VTAIIAHEDQLQTMQKTILTLRKQNQDKLMQPNKAAMDVAIEEALRPSLERNQELTRRINTQWRHKNCL